MVALRAQHANHSVANAGVAQVPHMCGFIAINCSMFDDDLRANAHIILAKICSSV